MSSCIPTSAEDTFPDGWPDGRPDGRESEIVLLSPAGAGAWAELGNYREVRQ